MAFLSPETECFLTHHIEGKYLGNGRVIPTNKNNKEQVPIPGYYDVFECARCGDAFTTEAHRTDLKEAANAG